MSFWKTKLLPQIQKVFDKGGKKALAAEFIKSFDESKENINNEVTAKKEELLPKVLEIYESCPPATKTLIKEHQLAELKKNSADAVKFLDELSKIEFPGSKVVSEAVAKAGLAPVTGPVLFIFEKVSSFLPSEPEVAKEAPATTEPLQVAAEEATGEPVVEDKKEEPAEQKQSEITDDKPTEMPPAESSTAPATVSAEPTAAPAETAGPEVVAPVETKAAEPAKDV